jgi:hypothetical protein
MPGGLMRFTVLILTALFSISAFASEIRELSVTDVKDISIITGTKACSQTKKVFLGFKKKTLLDCFGLRLRGVTGTSATGAEETIADLVIFPAGLTRDQVEQVQDVLIQAIRKTSSAGTTVELSSVRYLNPEIELGLLTNDKNDHEKVFLGGVSGKIVHTSSSSYGNTTETDTQTSTFNVGVQ